MYTTTTTTTDRKLKLTRDKFSLNKGESTIEGGLQKKYKENKYLQKRLLMKERDTDL
jgi:hypothetical protein